MDIVIIALGVMVIWALCAVASTRVKKRRDRKACREVTLEIQRQERMVSNRPKE
ncbi:MAG: hypothetical protein WC455_19200 [Dehalococcoidia bacterium]|jgi:hypothetical protein